MTAFLLALCLAVAARAEKGRSFDELWRQSGGQLTPAAAPAARPEVAATVEPGAGPGADIVLVGDSHSVGPFGERLYGRLSSLGSVAQFSVCGATINWWLDGKGTNACGYVLRGPGQETLRERWRPQGTPASPDRHAELASAIKSARRAVVIALGANKNGDLVSPGARLMSSIPAGVRCFWVSPPPVPHSGCEQYDRGDFQPTFERIRAAAGRDCTLIDSARYVRARDSSGCHFDNPAGAAWGEGVGGAIAGGL